MNDCTYVKIKIYNYHFNVINLMENYNIYCKLRREIRTKKLRLSDLKLKSSNINAEIELLEIGIEEDMNGLNMIFDYIILHNNML